MYPRITGELEKDIHCEACQTRDAFGDKPGLLKNTKAASLSSIYPTISICSINIFKKKKGFIL